MGRPAPGFGEGSIPLGWVECSRRNRTMSLLRAGLASTEQNETDKQVKPRYVLKHRATTRTLGQAEPTVRTRKSLYTAEPPDISC
jgi:hypothetical protein